MQTVTGELNQPTQPHRITDMLLPHSVGGDHELVVIGTGSTKQADKLLLAELLAGY